MDTRGRNATESERGRIRQSLFGHEWHYSSVYASRRQTGTEKRGRNDGGHFRVYRSAHQHRSAAKGAVHGH